MNHRTRTLALLASGLAVFGCADPPSPAPGPLMAVTPPAASPEREPAADPAPAVAIGQPAADHPAYAAAGTATPNRAERALGIEPVPEPPAVAPPLRVDFGRTARTSSLGSSEPTMDAKAPVPASAGCEGGLRGLSTEFPWGGAKGGAWNGTGHPDPEPLKGISDDDMLALAGDLGQDSADREHALVSIGRRQVPGAIEVFRDSLEPSQPHGAREMALSGLMEHGGPGALRLMWKTLTGDASAQLRGMAIWAVALYGADEATRAITAGLEDPTFSVQGMAILAVWAIKDRPGTALPILEAAAKSDEQLLWQEGLNVLARMPYSDAGNILRRVAHGSEGEKRNSAVLYYRMWRNNFPDLCQ